MQSRLVNASTGTAFTIQGSHGSYTPSTSSHRLSDGQDVLRGVLVAVVMCAAFFAVKFADIQRHLFVNVPTSRAALATGKESVSESKLFSVPSALVFEHAPELAEGCTEKVLGEFWIPNHTRDVQVLYSDHVESTHEISREFIQGILSSIGDLLIQSRDLDPLPIPALASFYATRHDALKSGEFISIDGGMSRIWNPFAITERCESVDPKVDPDFLSGLSERLLFFVKHETHEVLTSAVLGYRNRSGDTRKISTPADSEMAELRDAKAFVDWIPGESSRAVLYTLWLPFGSKYWTPTFIFKKFHVSALELSKGLLLRDAGRFKEPREFWIAPMFCPRPTTLIVIYRHSGFKSIYSNLKSEVICMSCTSKLFFELTLLATSWIKSIWISDLHWCNLSLNTKEINPSLYRIRS